MAWQKGWQNTTGASERFLWSAWRDFRGRWEPARSMRVTPYKSWASYAPLSWRAKQIKCMRELPSGFVATLSNSYLLPRSVHVFVMRWRYRRILIEEQCKCWRRIPKWWALSSWATQYGQRYCRNWCHSNALHTTPDYVADTVRKGIGDQLPYWKETKNE